MENIKTHFIDWAKFLTESGFYIFPIIRDGKTPAIKDWQARATQDYKDFIFHWKSGFNIGIYTGRFGNNEEGLVVVDVDVKNGKVGLQSLQKILYQMPRTFMCRTATNGLHYIYKNEIAVKQGVDVLGKDIDIRSKGGYIVAPGSVIGNGLYQVTDNPPIYDCPGFILLACAEKEKAPVINTNLIEANEEAAMVRALEYLRNKAPLATQGDAGDHTTFTVAAFLKDLGLNELATFNLMAKEWNERCAPPWGLDELEIKVRNAYSYGQNSVGALSPEADFKKIEESKKEGEKESKKEGEKEETKKEETKKEEIRKENWVERYNEEFAFTLINGDGVITRTYKDKVEFMKVGSFINLKAADYYLDGNNRKVKYTTAWMEHKKRRTYNGIAFNPEKETDADILNLWRGFKITPIERVNDATAKMKRGVHLWRKHLLENVCGGDTELALWLWAFFAHMVQRPWEKPLVSVVFKGGKGVGKNSLISGVNSIFNDDNHYTTAKKNDFLGRFNEFLDTCLSLTLDEAFWSGDRAADAILKDLVTGETHNVERKHIARYKVKNFTRIFIIGNDDWLVPASNDERRYAVFNVGDNWKQNTKIFKEMHDCLVKEGGNRLLFRMLLDFDLERVNTNDAPNTPGLLEQKLQSLNPVQSWIFDGLLEGKILNLVGQEFESEGVPEKVLTEEIYEAFRKSCGERRISSWMPDRAKFGKEFLKVIKSAGKKQLRDGGKRACYYLLPSLEVMKKDFEKFIGHRVAWDEH